MIVNMLRKTTVGAVVAVATMAFHVPDADAWWWHGSSGGSYGSWGSSGGSWGSSGGSWGSSGGIIHRIRARRAWRHYYHSSGGSHGSWGSSGGSHGSWGSSGGSHGSWGSSGGSHGSHGSSGGSHGSWGSHGGQPVQTYQVTPEGQVPEGQYQNGAQPFDEPPVPPDASALDDQVRYMPRPGSALVGVRVPAEAKVFVNGRPTRSTGARRWYVSRDLEPGRAYAYEVRAEWVRGDETLVETKQVQIRGGQRADMVFRFDSSRTAQRPSDDEPRTTLILRVPEGAKVTLAGHETKSKGPVREFSTTKLAADGQWANYPVRVEIQRDGETLVKERTIKLAAGQTKEVAFDFDAPQVAQALATVSQ